MPHAAADKLALEALNLLGVAIEAEHAEAIARMHKVVGEIAAYLRDLRQGAQVALCARSSAIFSEMMSVSETIPAWQALDGKDPYTVNRMAYVAFASEREAERFCAAVKEKIGVVLTTALVPEGTRPKYWLY